ncbi:helix-turn-helix transcriptional regulator [Entomohabitans teleogrylli]|uniref:helix-turn-helix transcriptional regulator n=1 Tax=Entomohabitans teleogrylli TaxID=1384589 RepID=UPI00073D8FA2|nr:hypothetical protein [Entomohabitans teleogrylli]
MASHDPMDLNARSQAFYRDFYLHHRQSCDAWYIKDTNGNYIDASVNFLSRFAPSGTTPVTGFCDSDLLAVSGKDFELMRDFESQSVTNDNEVTLFTYGYFCDDSNITAFILRLKPFTFDNQKGVVAFINDIHNASQINRDSWLSVIIPPDSSEFFISYKEYSDMNPQTMVTEKEWEVVWLTINGKSTRWIAEYLDKPRQVIETRMRNAYLKLRVFDHKSLLYIANHCSWHKFIPENVFNDTAIVRLS